MANTSQPLSETAIANMGGTILEERELLSLDDGTTYARLAAREFGSVRDETFKSYPWHFNKTLAVLAPNASPPKFQWKYAYAVPTDCLRLEPLRTIYPNGPKIPFQLMSRTIYTNRGPALNVIYGRRITNAAEFDPLFARVLGCRLAQLACIRITGKANYYDKATQQLELAVQASIHADALERGSDDYTDLGYAGGNAAPFFDVLSARGNRMA